MVYGVDTASTNANDLYDIALVLWQIKRYTFKFCVLTHIVCITGSTMCLYLLGANSVIRHCPKSPSTFRTICQIWIYVLSLPWSSSRHRNPFHIPLPLRLPPSVV